MEFNSSNGTSSGDFGGAILGQLLQTRVHLATSDGVVQFVLVMIPSFILNSLIVASYVRCKFVRNPLNLLFAGFSAVSIVGHVMVTLISFIGFPIGLVRGDCALSETSTFVRGLFILTLGPLTVTCISVAQCLIVVWGRQVVTYRRVVVTLSVVWTYALILRLILYVVDVSLVDNNPAFCSTPREERSLKLFLRISRNIVAAATIDIPTLIIVIVSTVTSCARYQKHSIRKEGELQRKMLLLPILFSTFLFVTTFLSRFVFSLLPLFLFEPSIRVRVQSSIPYVAGTIEFLSISNSPLFAALLIYLNISYRKGIKEILSKALCSNRKSANRVHPIVTPSGPLDVSPSGIESNQLVHTS